MASTGTLFCIACAFDSFKDYSSGADEEEDSSNHSFINQSMADNSQSNSPASANSSLLGNIQQTSNQFTTGSSSLYNTAGLGTVPGTSYQINSSLRQDYQTVTPHYQQQVQPNTSAALPGMSYQPAGFAESSYQPGTAAPLTTMSFMEALEYDSESGGVGGSGVGAAYPPASAGENMEEIEDNPEASEVITYYPEHILNTYR